MSAHTAVPWTQFKPGSLKIWAISDTGMFPVAEAVQLPCIGGNRDIHAQAASDQEKANAAFICRAVNAHDDLVAALEMLIAADTDETLDDSMFEVVRLALAKARGKSA